MAFRINSATARPIAICVTIGLVLSACGPTTPAEPGLAPTRVVATVSAALAEATDAPADPSASATTQPSANPTRAPRATAPAAASIAPVEPLAPACTEVKPALTTPETATIGPETAPTGPPTGQIVYLTGDGNIALTDATGSITAAVTTDAFIDEANRTLRVYQFPTFSNDGASLAFVQVNANGTTSQVTQTLQVAEAKDQPAVSTIYETTVGNIPYLDWSPDSSKLAFLTIAQANGAIRLVSPTGGPISTLDIGSSAYWHWRNDSTAIVAHLGGTASDSPDAHLAVIDTFDISADTSQLSRLASSPGQFQAPHFSPNGKFMLYVAGASIDQTINDLILADAAGKPVCTVTRMEAGAFFAWSPAGTQIAYLDTVAPLQVPRPLTILDLETGKRLQVDRDGIMFFWSPTGNRLALYSIFDTGAASESSRPSSSAGSTLNTPAQQTQRVLRIEMIDAATGKAVKVADTLPTRDMAQFFQYFDQYSRAMTPWSPDGRSLVFVSAAPSSPTADIGVATLSAASTAISLTRIATGSMAFWSPR